MQPLNINTVVLRSLISFGIVVSNLYAIKVLPASAQSSTERLECIKKFAEYYYSRQGGDLSRSDALAKAEQICVQESNRDNRQPNNWGVQQQPTIFVVPNPGVQQRSPQQFAECVNRQMYTQKELCIDPWGSIDETCFYRGRGGKKIVPEPTGITLEQASSTCGG
ncbi:MAG: hypothetical protein V7K55_11390 [Nostoc sp.]|uniref:hypothetical protein n=1 Tax=Nostoc sp. TaxID=1180 RepID=UPI002FF8FC62